MLGYFFVPVQGQYVPFQFDHYGVDQGLSNQIVTCVLRDRSGYLWVGTEDGLNRFDGYEFKHFLPVANNPASLRDASISTLFEDSRGNLWVGTKEGGLHVFDRVTETFRAFQHDAKNPATLSHNRIYRIYEDAQNVLWVGTAGGLDKLVWENNALDTIKLTSFRNDPKNPESLGHNRVTAMVRDRAGTLWVGTKQGLNRMVSEHPPRFVQYLNDPKNPASLPDNEVYALLVDKTGDLWVGMWGHEGLAKVPLAEQAKPQPAFVRFPFDPHTQTGFPADIVLNLLEDRQGNLWFCGEGNGLVLWPNAERNQNRPHCVKFTEDAGNPYGFKGEQAVALCEDQQGLIWIAANEGGLNQFDPTKSAFQIYRHHLGTVPGLIDTSISTITETPDGNLWVGHPAGLTRIVSSGDRFAQPQFLPVTAKPDTPTGLRSNSIATSLVDSQGRLWLGTINGGLHLLQKNGETVSFVNYAKDPANPESLGNNAILSLAEDRQGTIWAGTYQGLYKMLDAKSPRPAPKFASFRSKADNPATLSGDIIEAITAGPDGALWVGTNFGLSRVDLETGAATRFSVDPHNPAGLPHPVVNSLLTSTRNILWIGTKGGLCRMDTASRTLTRVTAESGLRDLTIQSLLEDSTGTLWVGTISGLFRFDPETGKSIRFGKADGLPNEIISRGSGWRSRNGTLYFGTEEAMVAFRPTEITTDGFVPPVVLTEFLLANRVQPIRSQTVLPAHINFLDELTLRSSDNLFTVEFSGLDFRQPENNRYAYKLENLYNDWIETDPKNRRATFTNLAPGEYVLHVKAANHHGVWNESGHHLKVVVLPPWWKTKTAYGLFLLLIVGSAVGGYWWRVSALERRNLVLTQKVAERTAELNSYVAKLETAKQETEAKNQELDAKNLELDQKVLELNEKNVALERSQQQADRIFSALAEALPGTVLDGKYRLDEKIGAGGFGAVFRATHLRLNSPVAVKIFRPTPGNDSADAVERFRREGVSAAMLRHPNVIAVLDSGISEEGIAYLVMELLQGESLLAEMKRVRQFSLRRAAEIIQPVCAALAEAHRLNIIHRDIKPDNIFLHQTPEGEVVKVVDFGIAKLVGVDSGDQGKLTATGGIIGTPGYMAPERLSNLPYDGRSDVYSLGIMVFEMLAGRMPFQAGGGSFIEIIMAHLKNQPPSLKEFRPDVPDEINRLLQKALAKAPETRPTALEFGEQFLFVAAPYLSQPRSISVKIPLFPHDPASVDGEFLSKDTIADQGLTDTEAADLPTITGQFASPKETPQQAETVVKTIATTEKPEDQNTNP
ncbi:MAG: protein kinase [Blastocatellia bacterium]|nr:protein kinase [Blastocatellia bacterium]